MVKDLLPDFPWHTKIAPVGYCSSAWCANGRAPASGGSGKCVANF